MNVATEMVGERVAKRVVKKAQAVEALSKRECSFTFWHYFGLLLFGSAWGFSISLSPHVGTALLGAISGAAFFLAAAAFRECISMRRKLAAVIVLLQQGDPTSPCEL